MKHLSGNLLTASLLIGTADPTGKQLPCKPNGKPAQRATCARRAQRCFTEAEWPRGTVSTLPLDTFLKDKWVQAALIVYRDSLVTHLINGDTVLQYTRPQIGGGVANNFNPGIKQDGKPLIEGYIGLQS